MSPDSHRADPWSTTRGVADTGTVAHRADDPDDALPPGSMLAGYEIEALAGRGGMGIVYRARERSLGRSIALKVIAPELARDASFRERFIRESRLTARMEHPNVVPVYRAGEDAGRLYIAMRYVDGTDLGSLLRQGALAPADATRIVTEIARALDAAHAMGLVHRDVKPANVLLGPGDDPAPVYLTDFGLSVEDSAAGELTGTGGWIGTPAYVAPEQIRGTGVNARTDVYALGCVLYQCLTGSEPYPSDVAADAVTAHLVAPPPRPSARVHGLPEIFDAIVARAMSKDPEDRYGSAGELAVAVGAAGRESVAHRPARSVPGPDRLQPTTTRPAAGRLPRPGTALIGREQDVTAILELLRVDRPRLVTLAGAGGTGKTRLAIEVATRLEHDMPGDAFFVSLAALRDAGLLLATVAAAIGVSEDPPDEALFERLGDRPALIVLDNLEQLSGADQPITALLSACPALTILATSRAPLRLRAERQVPVPPLSVDGGATSAAVELFVERARTVRPEFAPDNRTAAVVSQICARLDGLPLAIELAAARIRVLSPDAILERLDRRLELLVRGPADLPDRQRTLAATIAWSYELLPEPERDPFARLSVFRGSWSLEGAEAVIGSLGPLETVDMLDSLTENSLVATLPIEAGAEPRFTMLETIREYARARLDAAGGTNAAHARMAEHLLARAREAQWQLHGPGQTAWIARLTPDLDNVRATLTWAREAGRHDVTLGLAASLWYFLELRGTLTEARTWLREGLQASPKPSADRTLALCGACILASMQGDFDATVPEVAELEQTLPHLTDRLQRTRALMALGIVAGDREEFEQSRRRFLDAAALARGHNDHLASISLNNIGDTLMREGRLEEASEAIEEALRFSEQAANPHGASLALLNLGAVHLAQDDVEAAERRFTQVDLGPVEDDQMTIVGIVQGLGWCAAQRGYSERAALLLAWSDAALRDLATRLTGLEADIDDRARREVKASLDADRLAVLWREGSVMSPTQALEYALQRPFPPQVSD